jgi:signal transduction histidine kinase
MVVQDRGGDWWIPTGEGAFRIAGASRFSDIERLTPRLVRDVGRGPVPPEIFRIHEDARGDVWLAVTGRQFGLWRWSRASGAAREVTAEVGLPRGTEFTSFRDDAAGRLWIGTSEGLLRYASSGFSRFGPKEGIPAGWILGLEVDAAGRLWIASTQGGLGRIDDTSAASPAVRTYTMRDGLSSNNARCVVADARGRYRFAVRAVSADGQVSRTPATFAFTVATPLVLRVWFWAAVVAAASLAAAALFRARVARLLEVVAMRTRIATDLHDVIGANLTRISILSDVARKKLGDGDDDVESDQPLASISRIARESVSSMGDIVWAIDPRRDSLGDLVRRMRRHAEEVFSDGVALTLEMPAAERDLKLGAGLRRDLLLVFKEALNNASRHARASHVAVSFREDGPRLVLTVADDGAGFDTSGEVDGQGLMSMRRRAAALDGHLSVDSKPGRGTVVTLTIPAAAAATLPNRVGDTRDRAG